MERIRAGNRISRPASHIVILLLAGLSPLWAQTTNAIRAWHAIEDEASCADYVRFLEKYSDTKLAPMARSKLRKHCPQFNATDFSEDDSSDSSGTGISDRRDEILGYLRDPRGKDCPQVSLPFDDAGLYKLQSVCEAERAWREAESPDEQLGLLDALGKTYTGQIFGENLEPPGWIATERGRIQRDLACVTGYNKHTKVYIAARDGGRALITQRNALLAAQTAIRPCRDRLDQLGIEEARINGDLARVEQQIRDRKKHVSARQRLEQEITKALKLDIIPPESQVRSWQQRARASSAGYLSKPYADTLSALRWYHHCYKKYPSIRMQERLPRTCEQLGFRAVPQPNRGQRSVRANQAVALAVIRRYIEGTLVATGAACGDLYKTFRFLSRTAAKFQGKSPLSFEPTVRRTLTDCGVPTHCISAETMAAIQPRKAWIWTAFADCRLREARYEDAVENLDIATRYVSPDDDTELVDLIVRRLQTVGKLARGAGEQGFDEAGLRSKVGKKSKSVWLRDKLALEPRAPAPRPLGDTSTGQDTGGFGGRWYANHWNEVATLTYFETLSKYTPDIGTVMTRVEQARPELLRLTQNWDQKELGYGIEIGSAAVHGIVSRLRDAEPDRLDQVALEVTASTERVDLRQQLDLYPSDFTVRHAIARRAIELGYPGIATEQLQLIGAEHFRAVGPEAEGLHWLVLGYVNALAGLPDACRGQ